MTRRRSGPSPHPRWQWPVDEGRAPDVRAVKTACFEVARQIGGTVEQAGPQPYCRTFDYLVLQHHDHRMAVLTHRWLAVVALADAPAPGDRWEWPMRFRDDPLIGPPLAALLGARLLAAADLAMDWTRAGQPPPHVAGHRDLIYWRPDSVGDVIFNCWD